ncbi:MAG TPA: hypothetical protein VNN25_26970 [Thermoanaerobaculia bacterium]|nr:hypothetical protein [Thermoanaerobaculia bacterium]
MASLSINLIPAEILSRFNADQIVLICNEQLEGKVFGTTTFDPSSLQEIDGLESLSELRQREKVYSITATIMQLTPLMIDKAAREFEHRFRIISELDALLQHEEKVYVVYAVTHFNHKPFEELTIFIGGDCYRTGSEIRDLETVLSRTKNLAQAMIRKAVLVFPDILTLHGGKKGEWVIVDRAGRKIDGISEEAIVALGTLIIPKGIAFLNGYKEKVAIEKGIYRSFPSRNFMRPDTASPDVLSGPNWKAMCDVWAKRGIDLSLVTCLPEPRGGPRVTSAYPTGYGVVATALKLVSYRFEDRDRAGIQFLLEALGGVGQATVEALIKEKGISPNQITAFDKSAEVCKQVSDKYGIKARAMTHEDFYKGLDNSQSYDVWINNGEGDNTRPEHVQKLLDCGVRLFCGAANNFLKLRDSEESSKENLKIESLQKIFHAGGWAWPDEAASGGGWTLAVIDVLTRAKGEQSNAPGVKEQILKTIISRNEKLVDDVVLGVTNGSGANGETVWKRVEQLINARVQSTLETSFPVGEILEKADVTQWSLT